MIDPEHVTDSEAFHQTPEGDGAAAYFLTLDSACSQIVGGVVETDPVVQLLVDQELK